MGKDHDKFLQYKENSKLSSPDVVGNVIAGLATCRDDNLHEFSGKFINWNDDAIEGFYKAGRYKSK
jgi:hypothetical protein